MQRWSEALISASPGKLGLIAQATLRHYLLNLCRLRSRTRSCGVYVVKVNETIPSFSEETLLMCLGCGIKRLFDEKKFRGYGTYGYDVKELIAREQSVCGTGANRLRGL